MEAIVPVTLFVGLFAMIFGIRYLQNKENMAMIQNGMNPRSNQYENNSLPQPYKGLKWGLLLLGAGLGLFLAYILDHTVLNFKREWNDNSNAAVYFSLIGVFGGLGLVISYIIEKKAIK